MLALALPGVAADPRWAREGEATGSSGWSVSVGAGSGCTQGAGRRHREVTATALWGSRSRDKPYAKSRGTPCLFSTGKASPEASRVPKLLKRLSGHEAAPAGEERGVDHLLNPLRLM